MKVFGFYGKQKSTNVVENVNEQLNESNVSLSESLGFLDPETVNALNTTNHSIDTSVVKDCLDVTDPLILQSDLSPEKKGHIGKESFLIIMKMMAP